MSKINADSDAFMVGIAGHDRDKATALRFYRLIEKTDLSAAETEVRFKKAD